MERIGCGMGNPWIEKSEIRSYDHTNYSQDHYLKPGRNSLVFSVRYFFNMHSNLSHVIPFTGQEKNVIKLSWIWKIGRVCNAPMLCQTLLPAKQVTIEEDPDRQYHLWSDLPFPSFHLSWFFATPIMQLGWIQRLWYNPLSACCTWPPGSKPVFWFKFRWVNITDPQ